MSFGKQLTKIRQQTDLSQEELAEKINVSKQTVYRWEADVCSPKIEQIKLLCDIFKVSADYFVLEDGGSPSETAREEVSVAESENKQVSTNETVRINKGKVAGLIAIIGVAFTILMGIFIHGIYKEFFALTDDTIVDSVSSFSVNWGEAICLLLAIIPIIVATSVLIKYILKIKKNKKGEN